MHWSTPVAVLAGVLVVLVLVLVWRERSLQRQVGAFRCGVGGSPDGPWRPGVARFGSESLYWWRARTLGSAVPWPREGFVIEQRATTSALSSAGDPLVALTCRVGPERSTVHLLLSAAAAAGLTSWIEATPGRQRSVI